MQNAKDKSLSILLAYTIVHRPLLSMPGSFFKRIFWSKARKRDGIGTGSNPSPAPVESQPSISSETGQSQKPHQNSRRFGLNLLSSPATDDPGSRPGFPVDIVALHGITGDAFETFTAPNGTLWLQDFLSEDIPGARVFSYGYDASVFFTKAAGDIDFFARNLLEGLEQRRIGEEVREKDKSSNTGNLLTDQKNRNRPIVFVCHSMGGLVLKRVGPPLPEKYPELLIIIIS